jgi:phage baseplate assembly protein W
MNNFLPSRQPGISSGSRSVLAPASPPSGSSQKAAPNQQKEWLGRGWAFPVNLDRLTGGIAIAEYEDDIRQAIKIILGTAPGERVMRPDFGCGIYELVFEAIDSALLTRVQAAVTKAIIAYEARIELLSVRVNPLYSVDGLLLIDFDYRVRLTNQKDNMVYPFYFREGGPVQVEGSRG